MLYSCNHENGIRKLFLCQCWTAAGVEKRPRPRLPALYLATNQNVLDLILATLDMVHHHVLEDVLPVLQLVHLVVGVGVQHGPAQELGQRLDRCVKIKRGKVNLTYIYWCGSKLQAAKHPSSHPSL